MSSEKWSKSKLVISLQNKQYEKINGRRRWMLRSEVEVRLRACTSCMAHYHKRSLITPRILFDIMAH
jgi:hypothetical protein